MFEDVVEALRKRERAGALPNVRSADTVEHRALVGHRSNRWIVLNYHRIPHASGEA